MLDTLCATEAATALSLCWSPSSPVRVSLQSGKPHTQQGLGLPPILLYSWPQRQTCWSVEASNWVARTQLHQAATLPGHVPAWHGMTSYKFSGTQKRDRSVFGTRRWHARATVTTVLPRPVLHCDHVRSPPAWTQAEEGCSCWQDMSSQRSLQLQQSSRLTPAPGRTAPREPPPARAATRGTPAQPGADDISAWCWSDCRSAGSTKLLQGARHCLQRRSRLAGCAQCGRQAPAGGAVRQSRGHR